MMDSKTNDELRRDFIKKSALLGAGLIFIDSATLFANNKGETMNGNIKTKGYAVFDTSGVFKPWEFERRPVGENDVLIDIKYASICHSDIHQMKGHWGQQQYPQVPGHEIVGIVREVGKNVTCENEEQYQPDTLFTYGFPDKREPTGISQGGYSQSIIVRDHFVVHIPESLDLKVAAPLLCAGITTYSPMMKFDLKKGDKVGVAGIGGLGHMAIKIAVSKGAEVYAFTTSTDKTDDILKFGAKEAIVVDDLSKLQTYAGTLDYMISTIPYQHNIGAYISTVKPFGVFSYVGMPERFEITMNNLALAASRVNFTASQIGGMKETQEVVDYCAENKIYPQIEMIAAEEITEAWKKVVNKEARYRYVIDSATI